MHKKNIYPLQLSEDDFMNPMIKYLQDNNIERACWSINGFPIDVKKTFKDLNNESNVIIGQTYHAQNCEIDKCDLIVTVIGCNGVDDTITDRYEDLSFTFVESNNIKHDGYMRVPRICNYKTILKQFMTECDFFDIDAKEILKKYRLHDFDFFQITKEDDKYHIEKNIFEYDFVVKYHIKNCREIFDNAPYIEYEDVISCKCITSCEFQKLVPLINILSDLIYMYVDFDSIELVPSDYFV